MAIGKIDKNKIIRAGQGTFAQYNALSAEDKLNKIWFDTEKNQIYLNNKTYTEVAEVTNTLLSDDTKDLIVFNNTGLIGNIENAVAISSTEIIFSATSGIYSLNVIDNIITEIYALINIRQNVNHLAYDSENDIVYACLSGSKVMEIKPKTYEIKIWDTPNTVELCLITSDNRPWFVGYGLMTFDNTGGNVSIKQVLTGTLPIFMTGVVVDDVLCLGGINGLHVYNSTAKNLVLVNAEPQVLSSFKDKNGNAYFLGAGLFRFHPGALASYTKIDSADYMCGCCDINNNIYFCSGNNAGIKQYVFSGGKYQLTSTNITTGTFEGCGLNANGDVVYFLGSGQGILKRLADETEIKPTNVVSGNINILCNNQRTYFFGDDSKIYYTETSIIPQGRVKGSWVPLNSVFYDKATIDKKLDEIKKLINP